MPSRLRARHRRTPRLPDRLRLRVGPRPIVDWARTFEAWWIVRIDRMKCSHYVLDKSRGPQGRRCKLFEMVAAFPPSLVLLLLRGATASGLNEIHTYL